MELETILSELDNLHNKAINEEVDIFVVGRAIKLILAKIDRVKSDLLPLEKQELSKYLPEELKDMGVSMSGGGFTYKFDHIKEWNEKHKELKAIEEKAKLAFQSLNKTTIEVDKESGEIVSEEIDFEPAKATPRKQSVSYKIK